jgi:hypothetical protein
MMITGFVLAYTTSPSAACCASLVAELPAIASAARRHAAFVALILVGIVSATAVVVFPHDRALVWYGLYAIPAHLLISFLSHEPALFAVAKLYPPQVIATVGVVACSVAIVLDYWLIAGSSAGSWCASNSTSRARTKSRSAFSGKHRYS